MDAILTLPLPYIPHLLWHQHLFIPLSQFCPWPPPWFKLPSSLTWIAVGLLNWSSRSHFCLWQQESCNHANLILFYLCLKPTHMSPKVNLWPLIWSMKSHVILPLLPFPSPPCPSHIAFYSYVFRRGPLPFQSHGTHCSSLPSLCYFKVTSSVFLRLR